MYVQTNPNQAVAFSQGYQSGATALPISVRPSLQGNTVIYGFNPLLSQASAWGLNYPAVAGQNINPSMSQGYNWGFNPMLSSQSFLPSSEMSGISAWGTPQFGANPSIATSAMMSQQNPFWSQSISPQFASGQMARNTIQSSSGFAQMRVDLHETNSDVIVAAELPNVSLNDLNLTVTDDAFSISATAFAGNQPTSLYRTIALPTNIKAEQVEATYSNGILEIRAPKSDLMTRRRVKINVAQ